MHLKVCVVAILAFLVATEAERKLKSYQKIWGSRSNRALSCQANEFACKDNLLCIPNKWLCDIERDCYDGSDEQLNCPTDCSHANQFQCKNNECISRDFVCDGTRDCLDASDEVNCENFVCPEGEIKCDNFLCIEETWKCDGYNDCGDLWDERNCTASG
ncbi:low-density lipoprotein receptor-like isoform X1 [Biomphalaria pfeifferi]|uniref:Low-density lipoprotein receptor-like isoform X1 n=1 Tax=Biomphalaria pfeifferi TaxID=112525 RepID=A0AAD8AZV7_BIOPF|nr:low-density lipoprotein receptor-like isoform X1 [Biomphalaria pfeifferi]